METITIRYLNASCQETKIEIQADVKDGLAIHPSLEQIRPPDAKETNGKYLNCWAITHVASGRVMLYTKNRKRAEELRDLFLPIQDWTVDADKIIGPIRGHVPMTQEAEKKWDAVRDIIAHDLQDGRAIT